jgi:hypothetical protein
MCSQQRGEMGRLEVNNRYKHQNGEEGFQFEENHLTNKPLNQENH